MNLPSIIKSHGIHNTAPPDKQLLGVSALSPWNRSSTDSIISLNNTGIGILTFSQTYLNAMKEHID